MHGEPRGKLLHICALWSRISKMIRVTLLIKGRVQGVGFRANARRKAAEYGLKGWVRNLQNGDVELIAEGEETLVDRLIEWCYHGPSGAYVRDVKVEKTDATGEFWGFTIKR
jgi:acylphosphatase